MPQYDVGRQFTTSAVYHKAALFPGASSNLYQARDTTSRSFVVALAAERYIDCSLEISHNYTVGGNPVALRVILYAYLDLPPVFTGLLGPNLLGTRDVVIPSGGRWFFVPERSGYPEDLDDRKLIEVPELKSPLAYFRVDLLPVASDVDDTPTAPTAGEMAHRITRRA